MGKKTYKDIHIRRIMKIINPKRDAFDLIALFIQAAKFLIELVRLLKG